MTQQHQSAEWAQSEALRLADAIEGKATRTWTREEIASELRRLHSRVQELERESDGLRRDAERFRFADESDNDFAICYWDEQQGNGGEWMCNGSKGYSLDVLDAAIRARGAQGEGND